MNEDGPSSDLVRTTYGALFEVAIVLACCLGDSLVD